MGNYLLWIPWSHPNPVLLLTIGRRHLSSFSSVEEFLGFENKGRKLSILERV